MKAAVKVKVLRLPPALAGRVDRLAKLERRSINQQIVVLLEEALEVRMPIEAPKEEHEL